MTEYNIRRANGDDLPFIYSTWLNSFKHYSSIGKSCRTKVFFDEYKEIIDRLLDESEVMIACHKAEPKVIYGYSVSDHEAIHYIFVKEAFRKFGIANALMATSVGPINAVKFHTHETFMIEKFKLKTTYNPFLLYKKLQGETHGQT